MKIAIVSQHLPEPEGTATGRGLYALCDGLLAEGHDVRVFSWRVEPPRNEPPAWCEWRAVPREPRVVTRLRALARPRSDSERIGWHLPEDAIWIADDVPSFAAVARSPRSVMTFHYLTRFDARIRRFRASDVQTIRAERRVARRAGLVTGYSERVARAVGPRAVAVPIGYPVPPEAVRSVGAPVAGLIANWRWPPNRPALDVLRAAWPEVRARVHGARLILAGEGLEKLRIGASDGIETMGTVERVADFLERIAVLAFPCPDTSGPKVKVLEALAHGVPVLTTPPGIEGILLPAGAGAVTASPRRFGDVLASILRDEERRLRLGVSGREAVLAAHAPRPVARARVKALEAAFAADGR